MGASAIPNLNQHSGGGADPWSLPLTLIYFDRTITAWVGLNRFFPAAGPVLAGDHLCVHPFSGGSILIVCLASN